MPFNDSSIVLVRWDGSANVAAGQPGLHFRSEKGFLSSYFPSPALGFTQPHTQWVKGEKRHELENDSLRLVSVGIKMHGPIFLLPSSSLAVFRTMPLHWSQCLALLIVSTIPTVMTYICCFIIGNRWSNTWQTEDLILAETVYALHS
jgi:hypothetical protein